MDKLHMIEYIVAAIYLIICWTLIILGNRGN